MASETIAPTTRRNGKQSRLTWRYRGEVAARTGAALVAGYFLAYGATALLTQLLPLARADRVIVATLPSFLLWCAAAMYAFAVRSPWRAWWMLLALGGLMLGLAALLPGVAQP
jgi:hypothetical protein